MLLRSLQVPCPAGNPNAYTQPITATVCAGKQGPCFTVCQFVDLTGDGLTDYFCSNSFENSLYNCTYVNTGRGFMLETGKVNGTASVQQVGLIVAAYEMVLL